MDLCYRACGRGSEPFSFPAFAQESSAWLVPWLALLSQLPFGANDLFENANYIIMAVGSPTLIIYSLALSAINTRWIGRLFDTAKRYPNRNYTARAFNALQHCCFYLEPSDDVLASIIVLPQNDAWWEELVKALEARRLGWTISAFFNLIWVLIAFILTIIDALNSPSQDSNASGQSIGLLWLWLYPVVVGWIVLSPECDRRWLESQLLRAGSKAVIASDTPEQVDKCPPNKYPITLCKPGTSCWKFPNDDIYRTLPIFDFARVYWLNQVVLDYFQSYHSVAEKAHARGLVGGNGAIDEKHRSGTKDVIVSRCYRETPLEYQGDSVWCRVLKASIAALVVQWGTTASGFVVIYFTPTKGINTSTSFQFLSDASCRSRMSVFMFPSLWVGFDSGVVVHDCIRVASSTFFCMAWTSFCCGDHNEDIARDPVTRDPNAGATSAKQPSIDLPILTDYAFIRILLGVGND